MLQCFAIGKESLDAPGQDAAKPQWGGGVSDKVWSVISIGLHSVGSSEADLRLGSQNWASKVHFIISGI